MNDNEIVELFCERSEKAIDAVVLKYKAYCRKIAVRILGNSGDAEDCLNDALYRTWNSIPPHKPRDLKGYMGKLVRTCALDMRRKSCADKRGSGEVPLVYEELSEIIPDSSDAEQSANYNELVGDINAFLKTLSKEKRVIFVRRYSLFEEIPRIAADLGLSDNSVRVTLNRTRNKLKTFLRERGYEI